MKEFKGKTALITGAAYGFGKEFVKQAAKRGMKIVAVDIMGDELAKLEDIAKECGAEDITLITADVGIYEETEKVVNTALEKYGTIDILMNNAGVAVPGNGYNLPLRDWEWIVQTNFMHETGHPDHDQAGHTLQHYEHMLCRRRHQLDRNGSVLCYQACRCGSCREYQLRAAGYRSRYRDGRILPGLCPDQS